MPLCGGPGSGRDGQPVGGHPAWLHHASVREQFAGVVEDDRPAAHVVTARPEQGWSLLCDGTVVFDDTGELLPDGRVVQPRRVAADGLAVAA